MKWEDGVKENYKILDQIDFLPQLKAGAKIEQIMNWAEDNFYCMVPKDWDGCLFNWIHESEFVDYLNNRYPGLHTAEMEVYYSYSFIVDDYKEEKEEEIWNIN